MSTLFHENMNILLKEKLDFPLATVAPPGPDAKIQTYFDKLKNSQSQNKFIVDEKEIGRVGEELAINNLLLKGYKLDHRTEGENSKYDFAMRFGNKLYKFETKVDCLKIQTGNVAVEESRYKYGSNNILVPTGIQVWDCDFVIYIFPHNRVIVTHSLSQLRAMWTEYKENGIGVLRLRGGEDNRTNNYCIPYDNYIDKRFQGKINTDYCR